jgi:hypothetical protein
MDPRAEELLTKFIRKYSDLPIYDWPSLYSFLILVHRGRLQVSPEEIDQVLSSLDSGLGRRSRSHFALGLWALFEQGPKLLEAYDRNLDETR